MTDTSVPPTLLQAGESVGENNLAAAAATDQHNLQSQDTEFNSPAPHSHHQPFSAADSNHVMEEEIAARENANLPNLSLSEDATTSDCSEVNGRNDTTTAGQLPGVHHTLVSDPQPAFADMAAPQNTTLVVVNPTYQEKDEADDQTENERRLLTEVTTPSTSADVDNEEVKAESRPLLNGEVKMAPPDSPGSRESGVSAVGEDKELIHSVLRRPKRTCFVLCLAFFFVYTSNLAIQNLQTSLHQAAGLGVTSLTALYGAIIVFGSLSPLVIRCLTAKRTLVLAFICHLLYTVSNFYPTFPTLLTSSLLLGAMAGPMWTAQGLYCTATGMAHAAIKQMKDHAALSLFNGVFFAFYESTQISGNLIASLVLTRGEYNDTDSYNHTNKVCGAAVCPGTVLTTTKIEQPEKHIVYIMLAIFTVCNLLGLLLTVLALPPLPRHQAGESSIKKSTTSCLSMLLVPKMLLLLPFFMAQAMNNGILLAEYTEKFVSCAQGIQWVGFVMAAFGGLTSAQAVALNYAAKLLGRRVLLVAAALADLSVNVAMVTWDPTRASVGQLFILPCVAGFAEGIFQAQFNSLVAMVFPDQMTGAFATYHTSKATAFTVTFALARFLCLYQRLYVSLTLSTLGLIGYGVVEIMLHRQKESLDLTSVSKVVSCGDESQKHVQSQVCSDNDQFKKIKSP